MPSASSLRHIPAGVAARPRHPMRVSRWSCGDSMGSRSPFESQRWYMKSDPTRLLSVSRAAMGLPKDVTPGEWILGESAGVPPGMAEEGLPPAVAEVPDGAFT